MGAGYKYALETGSRKHPCPNCEKKTFVRYKNTETGDYLPEQYGRCDRESKCSYHLNPYTDGYAQRVWEQERGDFSELPNRWKPQKRVTPRQKPEPKPVHFDFDTFRQTLQHYEKNTFIQNLLSNVPYPFDAGDIAKVIGLYRLGTVAHGYRAGAITFPFIDVSGNVRAIQVKQFDDGNHTTGTDFLHSIIEKHHARNNEPLPKWLQGYIEQDKRITCLFGEHLLNMYPNADVYLFEAPKTAVYGTLYFGNPETSNVICLAVYNKSSFSFDKLKVLRGRFVYVFPDLSKDGNTFREWETKAKEFEKRLGGTRFTCSDLIERLAPEQDKNKGYDLADYLIKLDWRQFRKNSHEDRPPQPRPEKATKVIRQTENEVNHIDHHKRAGNPKLDVQELKRRWYVSLKDLQLKGVPLPDKILALGVCETIDDVKQAYNSPSKELDISMDIYLNRLLEFGQLLEF